MSCDSLIDLGVRQGTIISCSAFSGDFNDLVADSRALAEVRRKPVSKEHILLILSQDCDISNENVKHIEVLAYKTAKKSEISDKTQKGKNFAKLVVQNGLEKTFYTLENKFVSCIPKEALVKQIVESKIECKLKFDTHSFDIVLQWFSSRLIRKPFPHPFNLAFHKLIDDGLGPFLEVHHNNIIELYTYVSPDEETAEQFEAIVVALLSPDCSSDDKDAIEGTIKKYLKQMQENDPHIRLMQLDGTAGDILDNVAYVQEASEFIKRDELILKPYTLNYLCWPDDEGQPDD